MDSSGTRPQLQTLHARALLQRNITAHTERDLEHRLAHAEPDELVRYLPVSGVFSADTRDQRGRSTGLHRPAPDVPPTENSGNKDRIGTIHHD